MIPIAYAHTPITTQNIWLAWSFDPSLLVIALLTYFYFRGFKIYKRKSNFPKRIFFSLGIIFLILGLNSPIDFLAEKYFFFHMIQHLLIMQLAAPAILLGAPTLPVVVGANKQFPKLTKKILRFRLYRKTLQFFSKPTIAILFYLGVFWLWHLPMFYNLALTSELVHFLQHFLFFISAIFLWFSLIDPAPRKSKFFYLLRIVWVFLLTIANSALSALLVFAPLPYYGYTQKKEDLWVNSLVDQKIGGLIMWVFGNMMLLISAVIIFFIFYHRKTQQKKY